LLSQKEDLELIEQLEYKIHLAQSEK